MSAQRPCGCPSTRSGGRLVDRRGGIAKQAASATRLCRAQSDRTALPGVSNRELVVTVTSLECRIRRP